jgi:hypothetical protein
MAFDTTVGWANVLSALAFIVSFIVAAILVHTRLVIVEAALKAIQDKIESYENQRIERDRALQLRLNRIDDKLDLKEDK